MIGAVLAGGYSKRTLIDKLFYPLNGKPLILYPVEQLRKVRDVVKVVAIASYRSANHLNDLGIDTVIDTLLIGPLGALYLVLRMFREVVVVAGDMPFISSRTIERIIELCSEEYDACIPMWSNGYVEPLCAVYRQGFLKAVEYGLERSVFALHKLIPLAKVFRIPIEMVSENPGREFFNVNSVEDMLRLRDIDRV